MEAKAENFGNCVVITVSGELDTTTSPDLDALINEQAPSKPGIYIFGLGEMKYIGSVGLRVFLAHLKKAKAPGGKMIPAELNEKVQEAFEMAGFAPLFEIHPTLAAAKAAASI